MHYTVVMNQPSSSEACQKANHHASQHVASKVVLLYPDILNFTLWNVKNLKCKNFLIDFLDEFGSFKQKKIYTSKCKFFLHFKATDP